MREDLKTSILAYLIKNNYKATGKDLASVLSCSQNTITKYINEINYEYNEIIESKNDGYHLQNDFKLKEIEDKIPSSQSERINYIVRILLLDSKTPDLDELSDELFVSRSTINSDILVMRDYLKKLNVFIKTKNNRLYVVAEEKYRRKAITAILNTELGDRNFNVYSIQKYFKKVNIKEIEKIVTDALIQNEYFLDDYSLLNYVLHLSILIESRINNKKITNIISNESRDNFSSHIRKTVENIYNHLREKYNIDFTDEEIYDSFILVSTRIISINQNKQNFNNIENYVGSDVKELLQEIIDSVYKTYGINMNIDNFLVRFAFHLKNMIARTKNNLHIQNNYFYDIKNEYPFLFLISTYITSIIAKKYDLEIDNSEISYIALHLGVLINEKRTYYSKASCILLIYDYLNIAKTIISRLQQLSDTIFIADVVTDLNYACIEEIDFIITTTDNTQLTNIPQIKIDLFPTDKDLERVKQTALQIIENREKIDALKDFAKFVKPELYFNNICFESKEEAIDFLTNKLIENGYANPKYRDLIYEHENFCPSAYSNIAVPHPLSIDKTSVKKSGIAIALLKKPVNWSGHQVDIILMVCLVEENYYLFKNIFSIITTALFNKTFSKKNIDYKEFLNELY